MANVRVAVRIRPLSKKEIKDGGRIIVEVDGKVAKISNLKVANRPDGFGDSREKVVAFGFDYCYWSVNPEDPQYASQDVNLWKEEPILVEPMNSVGPFCHNIIHLHHHSVFAMNAQKKKAV